MAYSAVECRRSDVFCADADADADAEWYEEAFSEGGYQGEWCRSSYNHFLHLTVDYNAKQHFDRDDDDWPYFYDKLYPF